MNDRFAESLFTVLDDRCEFGQRHKLKGFYEVLFFPGACGAPTPFTVGVRFFPMHPFPDEIGRTFGAGFVRSLENDSVSKI